MITTQQRKINNFLNDLDFLVDTMDYKVIELESLEEDLYLASPVNKPTLLYFYTGERYPADEDSI